MGLLTASQGLSALQSALHALHAMPGSRNGMRSELGVSPFSWPRLLSLLQPVPPLVYSEFEAAVSSAASVKGLVTGPSVGAALRRKEDVVAELLQVLRGVVGAEVGADEPLMDAGLDSLGMVEFKNAVENRLGLSLPVTAVFDYPTISALAGYIHSQLAPLASDAASVDVDEPAMGTGAQNLGAAAHRPSLSFAVASLAGRASPGLIDGVLSSDGIRRAPLGRWLADESSLDGSDLVVFGGFIDDAELFDGGLFAVHPTEAVLMDPQQRLLLHFSWDALSGSGVDPAS